MCVSGGVETWRNTKTCVIIPICKKDDHKECTIYPEISLLRFPEKAYQYVKCFERKCPEIAELNLEDEQCGFRPGCSTMNHIFTLKQIVEKS